MRLPEVTRRRKKSSLDGSAPTDIPSRIPMSTASARRRRARTSAQTGKTQLSLGGCKRGSAGPVKVWHRKWGSME